MLKKEVIALILAGGQGSRLGVLTKKKAKPAVLYGGRFRIIDFSLSNCINSGIDTIGILTQYQPLKLNIHIGIGKPWNIDRVNGGITILSSYLKEGYGGLYKGTANAIFQNIDYIDKHSPKYITILSGDHIYKMDYQKMLEFHKKHNADATISVIDVPFEEAPRYGIINTYENGKVYEFEEKPQNPKSTLASMGVYIFTWEVLKDYLIRDELFRNSVHDFGKNIIPVMLFEGRNIWTYKFSGYWKDVGTIQAFWESNMDLIKRVPDFNLYDQSWKIYSKNPVKPTHYLGTSAGIKTSIIAEGCLIYGNVKNSVLFPGVSVQHDTLIEDSVIMSDSRIGRGCMINKCIVSENAYIGDNVKIGTGVDKPNELRPNIYNSGITIIGEKACIPDNADIGRNVMVDIGVGPEDFCSLIVASGSNVFKQGLCE